jgi:hypothetical protein
MTGYHLRMVGYLTTLNTYAVMLVHYFTCTTATEPVKQQRWFYLVVLLLAWVISLALGPWTKEVQFREEEKCTRKGPSATTNKMYRYFIFVQVFPLILMFFFAVFWKPVRERRKKAHGEKPNEGIPRPQKSFTVWTALLIPIYCGAGIILSYRFYKCLIVLQVFGFLVLHVVFIVILRSDFAPLLAGEDDEWGMGQVLALVLLLIPLTEFVSSL